MRNRRLQHSTTTDNLRSIILQLFEHLIELGDENLIRRFRSKFTRSQQRISKHPSTTRMRRTHSNFVRSVRLTHSCPAATQSLHLT